MCAPASSSAGKLPASSARILAACCIHPTLRNARSSHYLPYVDGTVNPSGELAPVEGTIYDFQQPMALGKHIDDPQLGEESSWQGLQALSGCRWRKQRGGPAGTSIDLPLAIFLNSFPPRPPPLPHFDLADILGGYDNTWLLFGLGPDDIKEGVVDFQARGG